MAAHGRQSQIAAMESPTSYDLETDELLTWFQGEATTRGFEATK